MSEREGGRGGRGGRAEKTTKQNYVPQQLTLDTNAHTGCISTLFRSWKQKNHSGTHVLVPIYVLEVKHQVTEPSLTGK